VKFLLINPAAPQWRVRPGSRPPLATRIFRFSMLSSLYVAAAAPPGVETRVLDEEVEPVDFDTDADLGSLLPLNRSLVPKGHYLWADTAQATRGCPQQCIFCSITAFFDHSFRARPVEHVTDELLSLAAQSGCRGVFVGFESLSQDNLRAWRKSFSRARDYARAIRKLHDAGIAVYAGIVFGSDGDMADVFERTLGFLLDSRVDALQATILTPFPGTPLFDTMEREGRIIDRDWSHYDFRHVVFEPREMSRAALRAGHDWVLSRFYSAPAVLSRLRSELSTLPLSTLLLGTLPLNYGYRRRLRTDGLWTGAGVPLSPGGY
jgi:radical SAM superfamily enzyme YgiQ (UPF0313 family)